MNDVDATLTYLRCEQLLAEARMRQNRLPASARRPEYRQFMETLQDSMSVLDGRCDYLRKRMHLLNGVSENPLELAWSRQA